MHKVRKGQGEYVRTVVNLTTKQCEEHYRIPSSGTLVKVCRQATADELKAESAKQQAIVIDRIKKEYFRRHPDKDPHNQSNTSVIEESTPVADAASPITYKDTLIL